MLNLMIVAPSGQVSSQAISGQDGGGGGGGERALDCDKYEDGEDKLDDVGKIFTTIDWTPHCCDSDDEIGNSHETATIEAALSIVSTAATLAGFHPSAQGEFTRLGAYGRHERFCCLHHIVQVSLVKRPQARRNTQAPCANIAA